MLFSSLCLKMNALEGIGNPLSTHMTVGVIVALVLLAVVTYVVLLVYKDKNVPWKYTIPIYITWYAISTVFYLGIWVLLELSSILWTLCIRWMFQKLVKTLCQSGRFCTG